MRLALIVSLLALSACDTTADLTRLNVSALSHDPALLVGTWDLATVTSAGYGAPATTTTAAALGQSETYVFRADSTVDVTRDGVPDETTVYTVETLADVSPTPLLRIGTETDYRRMFFGIDGDRLYVDGRPSDGNLSEYRRR